TECACYGHLVLIFHDRLFGSAVLAMPEKEIIRTVPEMDAEIARPETTTAHAVQTVGESLPAAAQKVPQGRRMALRQRRGHATVADKERVQGRRATRSTFRNTVAAILLERP